MLYNLDALRVARETFKIQLWYKGYLLANQYVGKLSQARTPREW